MDEATASVDVVTDLVILRAIEAAFAERTVLIIAHRLGTISHCDLVVEVDAGVVRTVRSQADGAAIALPAALRRRAVAAVKTEPAR